MNEGHKVPAIILAAGRASRFGAGADESKVVAELRGTSLVSRVARIALSSRAAPVFVVTGHAGHRVAAAVAGLPVTLVPNPDHASGMASSLKAGIAALPDTSDGVLVLLADMPLVKSETLDALIAAWQITRDDAVVPVYQGRRGNPVLLARGLFAPVSRLEGDEGARKLLAGARVSTCAVEDPGIVLDIDTRAALAALHAPS